MVYIYVLRLKYNKYYIGKTNNPKFRLQDHFTSNGSSWTFKFKPIKLVELIANCDDFDEDKYTKIYMQKYGIHNVRGGSYVKVSLSKSEILLLEKELNMSTNKCFNCGQAGHFANDCEFEEVEEEKFVIKKCYRCGRGGHYVNNCYAKTNKNGVPLPFF